MRTFLKTLFRRKPATLYGATHAGPHGPERDAEEEDDFSWMFPPTTLLDPAPWDQYWRDQLSHGVAGFVHLFCDDGDLVDIMRANGLKTVLCVGNGISQEPRALAWAGCDVTALDLSPFATEVASGAAPPDKLLAQLVGGRSRSRHGHLQFVVGDLCDLTCCPGPYDVVIDRKTLQLYPEADRPTAVQAVANRLGSPGIFFTQSHDGVEATPATDARARVVVPRTRLAGLAERRPAGRTSSLAAHNDGLVVADPIRMHRRHLAAPQACWILVCDGAVLLGGRFEGAAGAGAPGGVWASRQFGTFLYMN